MNKKIIESIKITNVFKYTIFVFNTTYLLINIMLLLLLFIYDINEYILYFIITNILVSIINIVLIFLYIKYNKQAQALLKELLITKNSL